MLKTNIILLIGIIFEVCESASFVEKIKPLCEATDNDCQKGLHQKILRELTASGSTELDIPKLDPLELKNLEVIIGGMVKILIKEGTLKGFSTCDVNKYKTSWETKVTEIEIFCYNITMEGEYKVESTPTLMKLVSGIPIHGEGKGGVAIDNLQLNWNIPYEIKKSDDGELHINIKSDEITSSFKILGKASVAADDLLIGTQEISTIAVNIINENWRVMIQNYAQVYVDKFTELTCGYINQLFHKIPLKELVTGDISSYAG